MSEARIYPELLPDGVPESEARVHRALATTLPRGWYAWHSLRIRTKNAEFSEIDFVIADPNRGLLLIEVKGGRVQKRNGVWMQYEQKMKRSPLDQAHAFRRLLLRRFEEERVQAPAIGVAVCFPDTDFDATCLQDDLRHLVIGAGHLSYLDAVLPRLFETAAPQPHQTTGGWIALIDRMWNADWVPRVSLATRAQRAGAERVRLDQQQFDILECAVGNDRVIVHGGAGTGKSLLAAQLAAREAAQGRRTLLCCFTDALGYALAAATPQERIVATPIRRFARSLVAATAAPDTGDENSEAFWSTVSLKAACDGINDDADKFDTVIVDEAQDLADNDWLLIEACLKPGGRLWMFNDTSQGFWDNRRLPDRLHKGCTELHLRRTYRCAPPIQALVDAFRGTPPDQETIRAGIADGHIQIVTSSHSRLHRQVGKELRKLLDEGLKPQEIAIISLRGLSATDSIVHLTSLADQPLVRATDTRADAHVVCDTFLRFKGLERPAIIVTDLRLVSNRYAQRMYIAASRALDVLRIVGVEDEIRNDPVLGPLTT